MTLFSVCRKDLEVWDVSGKNRELEIRISSPLTFVMNWLGQTDYSVVTCVLDLLVIRKAPRPDN